MLFSVWAPNAESIDLCIGDQRVALVRDYERFTAEHPAAAGTRYGYSLDGGPVLPDPRSNSQPDGVHGLSEVVEHDSFEWHYDVWGGFAMPDAIIYELHTGTFTIEGTFDAAIERLAYLKDLGVTVVEVMPIAEFPGVRGWGYDGVDLYSPHHAYGGPEGFKRFVDAAHQHGLAVMLDVVYNHFGPDGNYLPQFGPYFTDLYATPWGAAVNYDQAGSDEVRSFVLDNVAMWLRDYHVDGLRLDAVHAIIDTSAINLHEAITTVVRSIEAEDGRKRLVVAETNSNDPRMVVPIEQHGLGLDGIWSDDYHHALHTRLTGEYESYYADFEDPQCITKALNDIFVYDNRFSLSRNRHHGRSAGNQPYWRFIGCIQNHDQVGNRAQGDRLSQLVSPTRQKIGAALLLLSPFTPLLFAGEEWGATTPFMYFTHHDEELGKLIEQGRKREFAAFGWREDDVPNPQALETFTRSKLDWSQTEQSAGVDMLGWYRSLFDLRREIVAEKVVARDVGDAVVMQRGTLTVVANIGSSTYSAEHEGQLQLSTETVTREGNRVVIEGDGVAVLTNG